MRVTELELTVLEHLVVVNMKTDDGLEGNGFAQKGRSVAQAIAEVVRPQVIGEDPFDYEKIWHKMLDRDRWGGLLPFNAYGAVDVALWDIMGKAAGKPIHKLLGGYRDRVPAYYTTGAIVDPESHAKAAHDAKSAGFVGYKLHPKGGYARDLASCKAAREAVGDDFRLMSDPVAAYNHQEALRMGRELEKLDFHWFEEPLMDPDIEGYVELTRRLDIPVVGVEWAHGGLWGVYLPSLRGVQHQLRSAHGDDVVDGRSQPARNLLAEELRVLRVRRVVDRWDRLRHQAADPGRQ